MRGGKIYTPFWNEITGHTGFWAAGFDWPLAGMQRQVSIWMALTFGQPGFFVPRQLHDWFSANKPISYYDTSALKGTLERLVDFDRINKANDIRLSVGAVNICMSTIGTAAYFRTPRWNTCWIILRAEAV